MQAKTRKNGGDFLILFSTAMRLLDLTLPTLPENLALEEALLLEASQIGECLRFWDWPHEAVVLGASGILRDEVDVDQCAMDHVPIYRRASGGGTVLLGPGCLGYALVLSLVARPELQSVTTSYQTIMNTLAAALQPLVAGTQVQLAGRSDLALGTQKFSGNAQRRVRHFLLHHGTILYHFDIEKLARYLPQPKDQPAYRVNRPHREFVRNFLAPLAAIKERMILTWQAHEEAPPLPKELIARLLAEKYTRPEWIMRR
jgi:lipoate---protein ligase